jgi:hypothetical protein
MGGKILMNIINTITDIGILISSICSVIIAFLLYKRTSSSYKLEEKSRNETKEIQNEMKKMQNEYYLKSVQPIPFIACNQIGGSIKIEIRNYGLGAMIVRNISIKDRNSENQEYNALYKIFPENIKIYKYSVDIKGRPIAPNGYITLIDFEDLNGDESKSVRDILGKYKIIVEYQDVYGNKEDKEKNFYDIFCVEYRLQNKKISDKSDK